jgi:hypothetical protein
LAQADLDDRDEMNPGDMEGALVTKSDLARELNAQIRKIGGELPRSDDMSEEFTFYCECSCLRPMSLTLADFDAAGGAFLANHSRPES